MALATRCPHCGTSFRVAADQLKLRGGIVRCGACQEVFDGNAALFDLDAAAARASAVDAPPAHGLEAAPANAIDEPPENVVDAPPAIALEAAQPNVHDEPPEHFTDAPQAHSVDAPQANVVDEPLAIDITGDVGTVAAEAAFEAPYTLDFDAADDPFAVLPKSAAAVPDAHPDITPAPAPDIDADLLHALQVEQADAAPIPQAAVLLHQAAATPQTLALPSALPPATATATAPAKLSTRPSAPADRATRAAPKSAPSSDSESESSSESGSGPASTAPPEPDEPDFVKRDRARARAGRNRRLLMAAGSALLLPALAFQILTLAHDQLAAHVPALAPLVAAACLPLGCKIALPAQIEALAVDPGELQTLARPDTFALLTQMRNQGNIVQAWPSIELTLSDDADQPVLRRVIGPPDYLPPTAPVARGFPAHAEQGVKLYFEIDQLKASNYHIAVFYP